MHDDALVRMANQIADFFRNKPEADAVAGTASHINKFWDPRMRTKFIAHLAAGGEGLNPIALKAGAQIRPPQAFTPAPLGAQAKPA
jgi:formate dehydrogenase subunit delta